MIYGVSYLKKDVNLKLSYKNLLKSKGAISMIISSFLMAIGRTIDGFLTKSFDKLGYSLGVYLVISVYFFLISFFKNRNLRIYVQIVKSKIIALVFGGVCNAYAYFALLMAFKKIDVSIAEPISMLSSLVSILVARFIFKENIKLRFFGATILISGAFIIYI